MLFKCQNLWNSSDQAFSLWRPHYLPSSNWAQNRTTLRVAMLQLFWIQAKHKQDYFGLKSLKVLFYLLYRVILSVGISSVGVYFSSVLNPYPQSFMAYTRSNLHTLSMYHDISNALMFLRSLTLQTSWILVLLFVGLVQPSLRVLVYSLLQIVHVVRVCMG